MMRATILFAGITAITHAASDAQRQREEKSDPNQAVTEPLGRLSVRKVTNPNGIGAYTSPACGYHSHHSSFSTGDYILVEVKKDTKSYRVFHQKLVDENLHLYVRGEELKHGSAGVIKKVEVKTSFDIEKVEFREGSILYLNVSEPDYDKKEFYDMLTLLGAEYEGEPIPQCCGLQVQKSNLTLCTDMSIQEDVSDTVVDDHEWFPELREGCCNFINFDNANLNYYFLKKSDSKDILVHWTSGNGHYHHDPVKQRKMFAPIEQMETKFREHMTKQREDKTGVCTGIAKILGAEVCQMGNCKGVMVHCEQTIYKETTRWRELHNADFLPVDHDARMIVEGLGRNSTISRHQFDFLNDVAAANADISGSVKNKTLKVKVVEMESETIKKELLLAPICPELSDCAKIIQDLEDVGVKVTGLRRRLLRSRD